MTMAVCFKCGVIKFGAFVPCPKCSAYPQTEDDLALSLAMTDHFFDMPTLEQIGASVRDGKPPDLDPATHAQLVEQIQSVGGLAEFNEILQRGAAAHHHDGDRPPRKKPWWQFW
jgi:hypothetical protein